MKSKRHERILQLVAEQSIDTQEELASILSREGFQVTQATVSRDIKELGLTKILTPAGGYRYATMERAESDLQDRFNSIFSHSVLSITAAGNLIVIKTVTASANAAAEAVDSLKWPEIAGSIAGDNTIFLAVHDSKCVPELIRRFQKMMK